MTTQYATASYQEIIDLQTQSDKVTILGIHTPVTDAPYTFLQGFFDAFQKYHYNGCSLSLVPAARLPADPSQVHYEAGEQPLDPRDLLNPILWHGAHGESLGSVLNQFYAGGSGTSDVARKFSDSAEINEISQSQIGNDVVWQSLYYRALTDNTWKKAHPLQGFRVKGLHPLVYSLGINAQYSPYVSGTLMPTVPRRYNNATNPDEAGFGSPSASGSIGAASATAAGVNMVGLQGLQTTDGTNVNLSGTKSGLSIFSERLHGLGWLDTRLRLMSGSDGVTVQTSGYPGEDNLAMEALYAQAENVGKINYLPRLFMGICLLPPAYKAEQYYRLVLNHSFSFKKFRGLSMRGDYVGRFGVGGAPGYINHMQP